MVDSSFNVGYTRDFLGAEDKQQFKSIGREIVEQSPAPIKAFFLPRHESPMTPALLDDLDVVVSLTPRYDAGSFVGVKRLLAVVRFGVGYDMVDVEACTDADVALCITRGAVDHSVAEAVIGWMLQLGHNSVMKDRLVRENRWSERNGYMGGELRGRTLGIVGFGGIGSKLAELVRAFGMKRILVFDPYITDGKARVNGVERADLTRLLQESDYISLNCPLTDETRNLIGGKELRLMKPTAYLINTSRGGIVDEKELCQVLQERKIAGAAVDVFAQEPTGASTPLAGIDNVILAPHCIAWTDDLFAEIGAIAARSVLDLVAGNEPFGLVNPEVLKRPGFQKKLSRQKK